MGRALLPRKPLIVEVMAAYIIECLAEAIDFSDLKVFSLFTDGFILVM